MKKKGLIDFALFTILLVILSVTLLVLFLGTALTTFFLTKPVLILIGMLMLISAGIGFFKFGWNQGIQWFLIIGIGLIILPFIFDKLNMPLSIVMGG